MYVLKLVPTVLVNGQNEEIMSVGARLSTFVFRRYCQPYRKYRCRNTRNSAAQSRLRSSTQGRLRLLWAAPVHENTEIALFVLWDRRMMIERMEMFLFVLSKQKRMIKGWVIRTMTFFPLLW